MVSSYAASLVLRGFAGRRSSSRGFVTIQFSTRIDGDEAAILGPLPQLKAHV
jgi:hypothetical protein